MPNTCAYEGWLVNPQREIPTDPHEYCWLGREPVVGCSHLRCGVCGEPVKQKPGFIIAGELGVFRSPQWRERVDALYDGDEWERLPFLQQEPTYRLYVCRCGPVEESFQRELSMTSVSGNPEGGDPIPWTCQGHPVLALPTTIDGVRLNDEVDVARMTQDALRGAGAPGGRDATAWLREVLDRLEDGDAAAAIRRSARTALGDKDVNLQIAALEFFRGVHDPEAVTATWELARESGESTARDRRGISLGDALFERVASLWSNDLLSGDEVRQYVLRHAVTPGYAASVARSLAKRDINWLQEHYLEVVRANPQSAASVILELFNALAYTGFAIEDVVRAVGAIPSVSREQLRHDLTKSFFGDARERVLGAIGPAPVN